MNAQDILVLCSVLGCVLTTSRLAAQSPGPGDAGPATAPANITDPVGIEPVRVQFDPPFIISYWGGPPKEEMTLARYKEIADCGFNVAFPTGGDVSSKHLDLCREAGIKGLVFLENLDSGMPWGQGDTPIKEILLLMKKEKYKFQATIELEYKIPEGSNLLAEVSKCVKYCKDVLA